MIVDAHMHMGTLPNYYLPDKGFLSALELMDYLGIDYGMQMHMSGFTKMFAYAYQESENIFRGSDKRIFYGLVFDPHRRDESLEWLKRASDNEGFACIKIHPSWHQVYADDDAYEVIWDFARAIRKPIVTHTWVVSDYNPSQKFSTPDRFEKYLAKYDDVKLVMGHGGGRYEGHKLAIEIAKRYPSVLLDTSGDVNVYGLLEYQVQHVGAERILFGSDTNMMDPRGTMGKILAAEISDQQKKLILGENAVREFCLPEK